MTLQKRRFTFLGTGTSSGVPIIGCTCAVCLSNDEKDKRLRTSAMLTFENQDNTHNKNIVIDTGPDFRQQMLREKVTDIEAIIFTHQHNDHTAGLDDIRPINFQKNNAMPIYATPSVQNDLQQRFSYAFDKNPYPGAPKLTLINISKEGKFTIQDLIEVQPIEVMHGKLPILGFRFDNLTYITDCKTIEYIEFKKLIGTKILVLSALHHKEHHAHMTLKQALELVEVLKPEQTYFTHISHGMGKISDINPTLPKGVQLAYDGLSFEW